MSKSTRIARVGDCPPGSGIECVVDGQIVALFNVDGTYYACDGVCPHQGGPLAKGCLVGTVVTCPWHGWQFDVTTGEHATSRTIVQRRFPVRVEGSDVLIGLEEHR
jgi:nitrite reductase (NADH) small subunit